MKQLVIKLDFLLTVSCFVFVLLNKLHILKFTYTDCKIYSFTYIFIIQFVITFNLRKTHVTKDNFL